MVAAEALDERGVEHGRRFLEQVLQRTWLGEQPVAELAGPGADVEHGGGVAGGGGLSHEAEAHAVPEGEPLGSGDAHLLLFEMCDGLVHRGRP